MARNTCALLVVAVLAGCASHASSNRVTDPHSAVLRAGDMPRGYEEGDDTTCAGRVAGIEDDGSRRLDSFLRTEQPGACIIELDRVWEADVGPPSVTSAAWIFSDAAAAKRAFRVRDELLDFTTTFVTHGSEPVRLGDGGDVLHGQGLNNPATAYFWRSGNVVAILSVEPADDRAALRLARQQQERIGGKTRPHPPANDLLLELDDPALKLPVYWLGRSFDPPGPLPRIDLGMTRAFGAGPGNTAELDYGQAGKPTAVTLMLWTPQAWQRFRHTLLGRLVWDSPCTQKTALRVANGRADIFVGYGAARPVRRPCPARAPNRVIAHVYFNRVVVTVNIPICYMCTAGAQPDGYDTLNGTAAVVRGLRLRKR